MFTKGKGFILRTLEFEKLNCNIRVEFKGFDDGVYHSESLGLWALSTTRNSKYKKTQRFGN
jgi:hypothetical protein